MLSIYAPPGWQQLIRSSVDGDAELILVAFIV